MNVSVASAAIPLALQARRDLGRDIIED